MVWSKESRQSRGYGADWERVRKAVLKRDNWICQPCYKKGTPHEGREVDHIISKAKAKRLGWTKAQMDDPSNLQCIAHECHKVKTKEEEGKTSKQKVKPNSDGWPVPC